MMLVLRKLLNRIGETIRQQDVISFVVVFVSIFVGGKIGQYLFFTYDTSPAVIWPPAGIALAAIFLGGYRMWLPILLGNLFIYITLPNPIPLPVSLTASIGYTLSGVLGAYALKYLGWDGELRRTRDAIAIVLCRFSFFPA
jgi:integral membrane sensor domain MASE1